MAGFDIQIQVPSPGVDALAAANKQLEKMVELQKQIITGNPKMAAMMGRPGGNPGITAQAEQVLSMPPPTAIQQAQAATRPRRGSPASSTIPGPYQRREAAMAAIAAAQTPEARRDAELARDRADRAISRAQPKTFGQKVGRALYSSRMNLANGDLMPLLGQSLELLGPAGPWVGALTAGAAAAKAFADAVKGAADRQNEFSSTGYIAGATPLETARMEMLGKVAGVDSKGMAGIAGQFSQTLSHNPMAMSAFGDFDMPGSLGKLDKAAQLMKAIDFLTDRATPKDVAIRATREAPELEPFLRLRDLPGNDLEQLNAAARARASVYANDPSNGADLAARMEIAKAQVQANIDSGLLGAGKAIARAAGMGDDASKPKRTGPAFPASPDDNWLNKTLKWFGNGLTGEADAVGRIVNPAGGAGSPGGEPSAPSPLDKNTQSNQKVAEVNERLIFSLDQTRQVISSGPLAAGAVPGAWRSPVPDAQKSYLQQIKTLGPFVA